MKDASSRKFSGLELWAGRVHLAYWVLFEIVGGALGALGGWLERRTPTEIAVLGLAAFAVTLIVIRATLAIYRFWRPQAPNRRLQVVGAAAGAIVIIAGIAIWSVEQRKPPPSLHDLYLADFPLMNAAWKMQIADQSIEFRVHLDFDENGAFISVYIPRNADTYAIAARLAERCNDRCVDIIHDMKFSPTITSKSPFDADITRSTDLVFTGRIFVYYEGDLSLEKKGALAALYDSKYLRAQFRGYDYLSARMIQSNFKPR